MKSDLHKGGNKQEMSAQANGGYLRNRNKRVRGNKKRADSENEQGFRRGSSEVVEEGSKEAGERPQLAFLRFRCGTIAAHQSVST